MSAATLRVPSEFPTMQSAIHASSIDDTILVAPGTYPEMIAILRRLTLISESGPLMTTIDAQSQGIAVFMEINAEGSTIEGFRVTGGLANSGIYAAGIHVDVDFGRGGRAIIKNNIVEFNQSFGGVGGVSAVRGSKVEDNLIQHNNQSGGKAISALEASGVIRRNMIRFNGNFGDLEIVIVTGPSTFEENIIVNNGFPVISTLGISGNGAVVKNNTIANNPCAISIVEIEATGYFEFVNNLITYVGQCDGLACSFNGGEVIRCNDVWGPHAYVGDCADDAGVNGNISVNPLFCDASSGDYHLQPESPCAPANSPPGCGLIGALSVCEATAVEVPDSGVPPAQLVVQPNPVNRVAEFFLDGEIDSPSLEIYDEAGRLVDFIRTTGPRIRWSPAESAGSGVYFARLRGQGVDRTVKFVVIR